MRALILTALLMSAASAAQAQTYFEDPGRYNTLAMQVELAQRDSLAAQQAAFAALTRADTEVRLQGLANQRVAAADALRGNPIVAGSQVGAQMNADGQRLEKLTDDALARSNARVLAIRPAVR